MVKLKLVKPNPDKPETWKFEILPKGSKESMFYLNEKLMESFQIVKKTIRNDWDFLYVIDGEVGSGKSVFGQQLAYFVSDGDFDLNEIVFQPKEFRKQVMKSKKYNAIVMDEAFRGMSSRAAMTQTNRMLMALLQEIRQRNLFIFIVIPSIWDLDKYVSLHRCKGLFHVYTDEKRGRGYWKFYKNTEHGMAGFKFKSFFSEPKNKYRYPKWYSLHGRFTEFYPLGKDEYKKKKAEALGDYGYEQEKKAHPDTEKLLCLFDACKNEGWSLAKIGKLIGVSGQSISQRLNKAYKEKNEDFLGFALEKEVLKGKSAIKEKILLRMPEEINNNEE